MIKTILLLSFLSALTHGETSKQPFLGQAAPPIKLKSLGGKVVSLSDFKGKFVVMHFAATWCPFCNAEAPNLEALWKQWQGKEVQAIWIDVKEPQSEVKEWARKSGITFPILLDEDGKTTATYAPAGLQPDLARDEVPLASNLIIDREGKVRYYSLLDSEHFDAKLTELKAELDKLLAAK